MDDGAQDLLIRGGLIVDGTGKEGYTADVLIKNGIIKEIGHISAEQDQDFSIINGEGKIVTPGFVDIHRHCEYAIFKEGFGDIELAQGITTVYSGSCGLTPFPANKEYQSGLDSLLTPVLGKKPDNIDFSDYYSFKKAIGNLPVNMGSLIGSCSVRVAVKGFQKSAFTPKEMDIAKALIREAIEEGAAGLSMGLMYIPEFYSRREELIELAKTITLYDKPLTCHIRGEGDSLLSSVDEIIDVARRAEVSLEISHLKACGLNNWGDGIHRALNKIEIARAEGVDVSADFYPYHGGATTLASLLPPSIMKDNPGETWDYLSTEQGVSDLRRQLELSHENWDNYIQSLGWERIVITSAGRTNQKYSGKSVAASVEEYGWDDGCALISSLLAQEQGNVGIVVMSMSPEDVAEVAARPYTSVISDALYGESLHPRLYGAFPRILREYVYRQKILTLPEAIRKMTSMSADKMKLKNRGKLAKGYRADINVFNPLKVMDHARFDQPEAISTGMDWVIVNGHPAWRNEAMIREDAGIII